METAILILKSDLIERKAQLKHIEINMPDTDFKEKAIIGMKSDIDDIEEAINVLEKKEVYLYALKSAFIAGSNFKERYYTEINLTDSDIIVREPDFNKWFDSVKDTISLKERFIMPKHNQIIELAVLFNDGKIEMSKIVDMVALCDMVIDRLYENGDITKKSSKED